MRPTIIFTVAIAVFVLLSIAIVYTRLGPPSVQTPSQLGELPLPTWAMSFGNPNAPVTVIELFDLHCPYCAWAQTQLDPLYRKLLERGELRVIYLDFIGHREALIAHQYLHCAYRQLGDKTLDLITKAYEALGCERHPQGILCSPQGPEKQLQLLQQYKCVDAPTVNDFDNAKRAFERYLAQIGVDKWRQGTPTFIIIKNGTLHVVVGAQVDRVASLISQ